MMKLTQKDRRIMVRVMTILATLLATTAFVVALYSASTTATSLKKGQDNILSLVEKVDELLRDNLESVNKHEADSERAEARTSEAILAIRKSFRESLRQVLQRLGQLRFIEQRDGTTKLIILREPRRAEDSISPGQRRRKR